MEKSFAVTGATGLLGSNLVNRLLKMNHEVSVLIKDENSKSLLNPKVTKIYGDISDKNDIEFFIQRTNPTHFVHLAAQTQAYDSLKYPYPTFYNNFVGTLNILESLREYSGCKAVIVASSDKAYGELVGAKYFEKHPLNGVYPYDASKSATDIVANSYRQTYKLPIVVTRACNIYGIGDYNKQRLIPGIIYAYKKNLQFTIRNGGRDFREYIHVEDVVNAYLKIFDFIELKNSIPAFNISAQDGYSTLELFNLIQNKVGSVINHKVIDDQSLEIVNQLMDSSLLREEVGWKPEKNMLESVGEITRWYLDNF